MKKVHSSAGKNNLFSGEIAVPEEYVITLPTDNGYSDKILDKEDYKQYAPCLFKVLKMKKDLGYNSVGSYLIRYKDNELIPRKNTDKKKAKKVKILNKLAFVAKWLYEDKDPTKVNRKYYNPLNIDNLYLKFANINLSKYTEVINFVNKYGLLGWGKSQTIPAFLQGIGSENPGFANEENLIDFFNETLKIRSLIKINNYIKDEEQEQLKQDIKIEINGKNKFIYFKGTPLTETRPKFNDKLNTENPLTIAKIYLLTRINDKLGIVFPHMQLNQNNDLIPGMNTRYLIGAIYYQFYEAVTESKKFKECIYCGDWFEANHHKQKYCPAPEGYERSPCENKYNQMKHTSRKRITSGKVTVKEEAKRLNRSVEEVQEWIENYQN